MRDGAPARPGILLQWIRGEDGSWMGEVVWVPADRPAEVAYIAASLLEPVNSPGGGLTPTD